MLYDLMCAHECILISCIFMDEERFTNRAQSASAEYTDGRARRMMPEQAKLSIDAQDNVRVARHPDR